MCKVRCKRCGARRTLAKPLDEYIRPPQCRGYGCKSKSYRVDRYRMERELKQRPKPCDCWGYRFPHRKGYGSCVFSERGRE